MLADASAVENQSKQHLSGSAAGNISLLFLLFFLVDVVFRVGSILNITSSCLLEPFFELFDITFYSIV